MYILENLWDGKITPNEKFLRTDTEYKKESHKLCEEIDLFFKDLSDEKQKHYEELEKLQYKLFDISERDTFIVGFRLGARIILDVVGEYKGQFKRSDDV